MFTLLILLTFVAWNTVLIIIGNPSYFSPSSDARSRCPDKSDVQHCLHKIYTGCFLSEPELGLLLSDCQECFCNLKDDHDPLKVMLYRSVGRSHRGSHVVGNVCLGRDSKRICDGVVDCVGGFWYSLIILLIKYLVKYVLGKDELPEVCGPFAVNSEYFILAILSSFCVMIYAFFCGLCFFMRRKVIK